MPRALAIAVLLGFSLRLLAIWFTWDSLAVGDQLEYRVRSLAMAEGREVLGEGKRPPGVIWYFAGLARVGIDGRFGSAAMGAVGVWLVWLLGERMGGRRVAAGAAFLMAAYPVLVLYGASHFSEPLYLALSLGAIVLLVPREGRPGIPALAGCGALTAAAALTREVGVFIAPAAALWILGGEGWRRPGAWARALVPALVCAASLAPYVAWQNRHGGSPVFLTRTTGLNLYLGNATPDDGRGEVGRRSGNPRMYRAYDELGATQAERESAAKAEAWRAIRSRMPWWPFEKILSEMPVLLTPAPLPVGRLVQPATVAGSFARWSYRTPVDGTPLEWTRHALAWLIVATWLVVLLTGTAGLAISRSRLQALLLLFAVAHLLPVIAAYAGSRYRIPLLPGLILGASWLAVHGRSAWGVAPRARRIVAVAAVALALLATASQWSALQNPGWT